MILTKNGNLMKFASGAAVNAIIPPDPTEIEYYNFGTSETLVTNVAKSIDLTNTGIVNANKKYVVIYGKYNQQDSWRDGAITNGIKYTSTAGGSTFFYLGCGDGVNPGFIMNIANSITISLAQYTGTRHLKVLLENDIDDSKTNIYTSLASSSGGIWTWPTFTLRTYIRVINYAKNMTSISTTGNNAGLISGTDFIAIGFDTIEDASAWNPIV